MGRLDGRVVVVTGAGRGLGRAHALAAATEGAAVVVNDLGTARDGTGADASPGRSVVEEIVAAGGDAVFSDHDVADWEQAGALVELAVEHFGGLHVLVNNAGIVRDRTLANMTEEEWDVVVRVCLKGHAAPTHHAMRYWRARAKSGDAVAAPTLVHTSSASGFIGNLGQANYGAAKMGLLALSQIARLEGSRFGLRSNVIGPAAQTRLGDAGATPIPLLDPANVSPLVVWLASEACPANGQVFHVYGTRIVVVEQAGIVADVRTNERWTVDDIDREIPPHLVEPPDLAPFLPSPDEQLHVTAAPQGADR